MKKYAYYVEPYNETERPRRFLEAFAAILKHSNYGFVLDTYSRTSTKCARCACNCQVFEQSGDPRDVPCYRTELLLRVYRRYFTLNGTLRARLFNGFVLTDDYIDEMAEAMYRCTACRRCKFGCPMGVDHGLMTHLSRWILAEIGIVPKALVVATREQLQGKTGNTSAIPVVALKDTCEFLEEELLENYNLPAKFPMDVEGAEYVFFPAVSDYLLEPDTLMGNAAVMHLTGGSWTIGTGYYDGINYGLFYNDALLDRIVSKEAQEIKRLKAKKALIGECGHASRSAKAFLPTFCGGKNAPPVINIMEYSHKALLDGRLKVKSGAIHERVTYHDPCNIARSKWIINQPRELLEAICKDFVDMVPCGQMNICCGGGAGTVSVDEIRSFRTGIGGRTKADQIRKTGAKYLVAPCANCKKQLREVCEDNELHDVQVVGLHDLILKALDLEAYGITPPKKDDEGKE
ncbi:(Fe-S)-binding protein [Candidatus Poribacteria bacterium]|nr:(Fe-S)-binding protein [Candidatus Poribacteria bacterium]